MSDMMYSEQVVLRYMEEILGIDLDDADRRNNVVDVLRDFQEEWDE